MAETALTLPDEVQFKADIQAINKFQQVVHANLIEGQDYGVIPGTKKATLLKPGAEKIAKLLGLCDHYVILDRQEDWNKPFFRYLIQCQLISINSNVVITEGLGECNSMESKYHYRWLWPFEIPDDFDKEHAVKKNVHTTHGNVTQYRTDNEDIFSQVNTLVKMAKKRSLVDAALSAGRLSNIFTQDVEDIEGLEPTIPASSAKEDKELKAKVDAPITGDFKNIGEFYTACLKELKLTKSRVDAECAAFDLTKPDQLKKAWQTIISIYGHKKEAEDISTLEGDKEGK
ncbi:MAG: hypothetical protein MUP81_01045 [Dehalococcoidia bacterium]|nr:hypothetical protein [Dehalococcoidia bacterium]